MTRGKHGRFAAKHKRREMKMEFLKKFLGGRFSSKNADLHGWQVRRLPQFELLESRELLAVNLLGPVTGYAQPNNPAEIRFELAANTSAASLHFLAQQSSGSTLDPSQLSLVNRSTGKTVALSNMVNGTTSSSASAQLSGGSYSIYIYADGGSKGNFTFTISQETQSHAGLDILVAAAIAQQLQPAGWANRVNYYNGLLANTQYAGAASAMPITKYYPVVDVNNDGKVNTTDLNLAEQLVTLTPSVATIKSHQVIVPNSTPPTLADGGSGNVTVPTGQQVQQIAGQSIQPGQSKTLADNQGTITLASNGSLSFTPGSGLTKLAQGEKVTVTVPVTSRDAYGNEYTYAAAFTVTGKNELPTLVNSTPVSLSFNQSTANSGTIKTAEILAKWTDPDNGAKLSIINPVILTATTSNSVLNSQSKYTPANLKQYLTLTSDGVTFTVSDSFFDALGLNETLTITVSYGIEDEYGTSPDTGTLTFIVTGKDNPSVLNATQTVFNNIISNDNKNLKKSINPGFSVTDSDQRDATGVFVYSFSNVKDGLNNADSGLITDFDSKTGTFNIDTSKLKNRNANSVVTLDVSVKSASGGVVTQKLTINLNAIATPSASTVLTTSETTSITNKIKPTVEGSSGFTIKNLTLASGTGFGSFPQGISLAMV
ncbi:MAG: VCBS domain-containing protein, partial [Planctomycetaceae bacterium]|nr:VCBS domain-containing protein [Planctomycetaceae bacterium]